MIINSPTRLHFPKPDACKGCPLYNRGQGFVPGIYKGKSITSLMSSTPQEPSQSVAGICGATRSVRPTPKQAVFLGGEVKGLLAFCGEVPALDELLQGKPFVGKAGQVLRHWVFGNANINFDDCFVDNAIRCVQPNNELPEPKILNQAIEHCRIYDVWDQLNITRDVITFHPAALLRDPVPLPLVVHDVARARDMAREGFNVRVLLGSTAAGKWYPYARAVRRWRGNVESM